MTLSRLLQFAALFICFNLAAFAGEPQTFNVHSGDADIPVTRYQAAGNTLLLWLPSEYGVLSQEQSAASRLTKMGYEVWIADVYGARFLPAVPSSAEAIPANDIAQLLGAAADRTTKTIYVLSAGRGAKYALEGIRHWQDQTPGSTRLAGAVLLYPNLYLKAPEPGEDPAYLPITAKTRVPVKILQGELSPWYWTLDTLQPALEHGGSRVTVRSFPGIRDRFYFRPGANRPEQALGERLPEIINDAIGHKQTAKE
jgi:dienelactone hydrolase